MKESPSLYVSVTGLDPADELYLVIWNPFELEPSVLPRKTTGFEPSADHLITEKSKGFIAQEMVHSFPEAYTKEDKEDSKYFFNPSGMVVYLMKAIQELSAKNTALETRVAALEAAW